MMKNLFVFCLICNGFILYSQNKMNHQIIPNPVSVKSAGGRLNLNDVKQIIIPEKNKGVKKQTQRPSQCPSIGSR